MPLNHLRSVAGTGGGPGVNVTVIKPLTAFTAPTATTITPGAEYRHDRVIRPAYGNSGTSGT